MLREYYTTKPQALNWIVEVNVLISIYDTFKKTPISVSGPSPATAPPELGTQIYNHHSIIFET
jgi:hypothetical protein